VFGHKDRREEKSDVDFAVTWMSVLPAYYVASHWLRKRSPTKQTPTLKTFFPEIYQRVGERIKGAFVPKRLQTAMTVDDCFDALQRFQDEAKDKHLMALASDQEKAIKTIEKFIQVREKIGAIITPQEIRDRLAKLQETNPFAYDKICEIASYDTLTHGKVEIRDVVSKMEGQGLDVITNSLSSMTSDLKFLLDSLPMRSKLYNDYVKKKIDDPLLTFDQFLKTNPDVEEVKILNSELDKIKKDKVFFSKQPITPPNFLQTPIKDANVKNRVQLRDFLDGMFKNVNTFVDGMYGKTSNFASKMGFKTHIKTPINTVVQKINSFRADTGGRVKGKWHVKGDIMLKQGSIKTLRYTDGFSINFSIEFADKSGVSRNIDIAIPLDIDMYGRYGDKMHPDIPGVLADKCIMIEENLERIVNGHISPYAAGLKQITDTTIIGSMINKDFQKLMDRSVGQFIAVSTPERQIRFAALKANTMYKTFGERLNPGIEAIAKINNSTVLKFVKSSHSGIGTSIVTVVSEKGKWRVDKVEKYQGGGANIDRNITKDTIFITSRGQRDMFKIKEIYGKQIAAEGKNVIHLSDISKADPTSSLLNIDNTISSPLDAYVGKTSRLTKYIKTHYKKQSQIIEDFIQTANMDITDFKITTIPKDVMSFILYTQAAAQGVFSGAKTKTEIVDILDGIVINNRFSGESVHLSIGAVTPSAMGKGGRTFEAVPNINVLLPRSGQKAHALKINNFNPLFGHHDFNVSNIKKGFKLSTPYLRELKDINDMSVSINVVAGIGDTEASAIINDKIRNLQTQTPVLGTLTVDRFSLNVASDINGNTELLKNRIFKHGDVIGYDAVNRPIKNEYGLIQITDARSGPGGMELSFHVLSSPSYGLIVDTGQKLSFKRGEIGNEFVDMVAGKGIPANNPIAQSLSFLNTLNFRGGGGYLKTAIDKKANLRRYIQYEQAGGEFVFKVNDRELLKTELGGISQNMNFDRKSFFQEIRNVFTENGLTMGRAMRMDQGYINNNGDILSLRSIKNDIRERIKMLVDIYSKDKATPRKEGVNYLARWIGDVTTLPDKLSTLIQKLNGIENGSYSEQRKVIDEVLQFFDPIPSFLEKTNYGWGIATKQKMLIQPATMEDTVINNWGYKRFSFNTFETLRLYEGGSAVDEYMHNKLYKNNEQLFGRIIRQNKIFSLSTEIMEVEAAKNRNILNLRKVMQSQDLVRSKIDRLLDAMINPKIQEKYDELIKRGAVLVEKRGLAHVAIKPRDIDKYKEEGWTVKELTMTNMPDTEKLKLARIIPNEYAEFFIKNPISGWIGVDKNVDVADISGKMQKLRTLFMEGGDIIPVEGTKGRLAFIGDGSTAILNLMNKIRASIEPTTREWVIAHERMMKSAGDIAPASRYITAPGMSLTLRPGAAYLGGKTFNPSTTTMALEMLVSNEGFASAKNLIRDEFWSMSPEQQKTFLDSKYKYAMDHFNFTKTEQNLLPNQQKLTMHPLIESIDRLKQNEFINDMRILKRELNSGHIDSAFDMYLSNVEKGFLSVSALGSKSPHSEKTGAVFGELFFREGVSKGTVAISPYLRYAFKKDFDSDELQIILGQEMGLKATKINEIGMYHKTPYLLLANELETFANPEAKAALKKGEVFVYNTKKRTFEFMKASTYTGSLSEYAVEMPDAMEMARRAFGIKEGAPKAHKVSRTVYAEMGLEYERLRTKHPKLDDALRSSEDELTKQILLVTELPLKAKNAKQYFDMSALEQIIENITDEKTYRKLENNIGKGQFPGLESWIEQNIKVEDHMLLGAWAKAGRIIPNNGMISQLELYRGAKFGVKEDKNIRYLTDYLKKEKFANLSKNVLQGNIPIQDLPSELARMFQEGVESMKPPRNSMGLAFRETMGKNMAEDASKYARGGLKVVGGLLLASMFFPNQSRFLGHMPGRGGEYYDWSFTKDESKWQQQMESPLNADNGFSQPDTHITLFDPMESERQTRVYARKTKFLRPVYKSQDRIGHKSSTFNF